MVKSREGEKGCRGFDSQYMARYIHRHTDTEEEDRKQGTLNTQWCFELRCMTSETESVSLSMLPETVYKKRPK